MAHPEEGGPPPAAAPRRSGLNPAWLLVIFLLIVVVVSNWGRITSTTGGNTVVATIGSLLESSGPIKKFESNPTQIGPGQYTKLTWELDPQVKLNNLVLTSGASQMPMPKQKAGIEWQAPQVLGSYKLTLVATYEVPATGAGQPAEVKTAEASTTVEVTTNPQQPAGTTAIPGVTASPTPRPQQQLGGAYTQVTIHVCWEQAFDDCDEHEGFVSSDRLLFVQKARVRENTGFLYLKYAGNEYKRIFETRDKKGAVYYTARLDETK